MSNEMIQGDGRRPKAGFFLVWLLLFLATALFALTFPVVWAKADEPAPRSLSLAGLNINGKFDLNFERGGFTGSPSDGSQTLKNYHHFVFLSRKKQGERVFFNAEIVDATFYEMGVKLGEHRNIKFGKIFVPFGADPIFHHAYGGLSGFDQKLVPFLWTELGAVYKYDVLPGKTYKVQNEIALVSGFKADKPDSLTIGGAGDPSRPALVDRFAGSRGRYSAWASLYWDQYLAGNNLFMWGGDLYAGYGFLPWSVLRDLSARLGFVRADVQDKSGPNYFHFGDYVQLDCRLPSDLRLRYRGGLTATDNRKGLFFDSDRDDVDDRVGHNVGLWWEHRLLTVGAEYFVNLEAGNEQPNDLIRFMTVIEF